MFEDQVIINPVIVEAKEHKKTNPDQKGIRLIVPNTVKYDEPCMSFPFRKPKRLVRYDLITVTYQIKGLLGLKKVTKELSGIQSEIFQHECQHLEGKNIFFDGKPYKWWELIGEPKTKGGTSLDDAEQKTE
jgi:peptide deformylase